MDSQAKRGSLIFQKIASNVHDSIKNNVDSFIEKKALENYQDDGGELADTVKEILKLFGQNERISIIGNKDLDKHLQSIAKTINSSNNCCKSSGKRKIVQDILLSYSLYTNIIITYIHITFSLHAHIYLYTLYPHHYKIKLMITILFTPRLNEFTSFTRF